MFCPNAADWGNVADWVAGIGTLTAVVAALHIAGAEQRSAKRERENALSEEARRRIEVITEAIRLVGEVQALAESYSQLVKLGVGDGIARKEGLLIDIEGIQRQLESLQKLAGIDPQLFVELGRTAYGCRVDSGLSGKSTSYAALQMQQVSEQMKQRKEALEAL